MSTSLSEQAGLTKSTRYHGLDALRAFAMLGGILLHLAIYFVPFHITGIIAESSGSTLFTYFIYQTHMYRMQVFFLLAGFFARLVLHRNGYFGFAWHRFTRIAIPFGVGWVIMYPLITIYHVYAAKQTETLLSEQLFAAFAWSSIVNDELAGFTLIHLWFLYYLLLCYVVAVFVEWMCRYVLDRRGSVRQFIQRCFAWQMRSRWNVVWLALPLWPLLYLIGDWFGIITPADSLMPDRVVLATYTLFFGVGWLLHSQADLLRQFEQGWGRKLAGGLALSMVLFVFFETGRSHGQITMAYPLLLETEVRDYELIRAAICGTGDAEFVANTAFIRKSVSELYRRHVEETPYPTDGQMAGWLMEINKNLLLSETGFETTNEQERKALASLKQEAVRRGHPEVAAAETAEATLQERRWLFEAAFPVGTFSVNIATRPYYRAVMGAFSAAYALTTWLLIFGFMGLFMRFFAAPSPLVRYIADSSYWLYLIHFPILWQLNILLPDLQWHWLPKSLLYLSISLVIMIPSYHYLVRSTWVGKLLNGRKYPFVPWFSKPAEERVMESEVPPPSIAASEG